jgi:hypothetical protein
VPADEEAVVLEPPVNGARGVHVHLGELGQLANTG